jgi:hypothetical protein
MSEWVKAGVRSAYMKIAEPRVIRIVQFFIYSLLFIAGILVLTDPPRALQDAAGGELYIMGFSLMLIVGALSSGVAVLPGIWWLERAGLVLLGFGLLIYLVMAIKLQSSPMGIVVCMILTLSFVQRWLEIKGAQLAPLLPNKRG